MLEPVKSPLQLAHIQSLGLVVSHLDEEDHKVNLDAVASHPLALEDVGQTLNTDQKLLILKRLELSGLEELAELPLTASFMIEKTEKLNIYQSIEILKESIEEFENDINIPTEEFDLYKNLIAEAAAHGVFGESTSPGTNIDSNLDTNEKLSQKYYSDVTVRDAEEYSTSVESLGSKVYSPYKIVDWRTQIRIEAALIVYHSPYQEVRSVTDPFDDSTIPVETLRVYFLGLCWTCIAAFVNEFFMDRMPGISLTSAVVQMFIYPCGKALEYIVPKYKFKVGKYVIDLNPGPWNYKEQILAGLMASFGGGSVSYVSWNITVQKLDVFYGNKWVSKGYQVLLLFSTNFMGVGFAGLLRKFVVYPTKNLWPGILPTLALNRALLQPEKKEKINGWTISRYSFFFSVTSASFLYYWIPDYLFQAVSNFNWTTWIKPQNFNLAVITGTSLGMGINPISTFDWNVATSLILPLNTPLYSTLNQYIGMVLSGIIIIAVYYTNYKWTSYLPINSNALFTNTGAPYDVTEILTPGTLFDQEKYDAYGPPFYTAGNLVTYGAFFALYPFAVIHEIAVSWKSLWSALKGLVKSLRSFKGSTYDGFNDPHTTMMRSYKEVPDWVFLVVLLISFVLAVICVEIFPTNTPVWAIVFAIGINIVFLIPITTITSTTNFAFGLNVLVELIIGYAIPGNGEALMFVKALGYNIDGQADNYISNQKIAHYAKVPPRALFRAQILGLLVGSLINMAAIDFKLTHFKDYCLPHQKEKFTCPDSTTYFSASVIWGVIGPKKVFSGLYPILKYCFLIGFLLAIPCVLLRLYVPHRYTKYFQPTLIIGGMLNWAPYNLYYFNAGLYLAIAFMWHIKLKYSAWWTKYNYVFSSGMGAGLAFSAIIVFFAVQYHPKDVNWWGNTVSYAGIDGGNGQQARLNASLVDGGYFGPRVGHFP